jgi:hypothetical protein
MVAVSVTTEPNATDVALLPAEVIASVVVVGAGVEKAVGADVNKPRKEAARTKYCVRFFSGTGASAIAPKKGSSRELWAHLGEGF